MLTDLAAYVRQTRRHPLGFCAFVLTLAVGLGGVIGTFDVALQALHGALPYQQPERLVVAGDDVSPFLISPYDRKPNPHASTVFAGLAEFHVEADFTGSGASARPLLVASITPGFFKVLGVHVAFGSDLSGVPPPSPKVVLTWLPMIVSHHLWQSYFHGDPAVVGRTVETTRIYPYRFLVVGVAPQGMRLPPAADAWIPEQLTSFSLIQTAAPPNWTNTSVGRLRPGIALEQAETAIRSWPRQDDNWIWNKTAKLVPLRSFLVGDLYSLGPLLWLLALLFLVLAAASATSVCRHDFALRRAGLRTRLFLGATPLQLMRGLCVELTANLILASALALFLGAVTITLTARYFAVPFHFTQPVVVDTFALGLAVLAAIALVITIPWARQLTLLPTAGRKPPQPILLHKPGTSLTDCVPIQVAVATVLLILVMIMVRRSFSLAHLPTGVSPAGVFVCDLSLPYSADRFVWGTITPSMSMAERTRTIRSRTNDFSHQLDLKFSQIATALQDRTGLKDIGFISEAPYSGYPAMRTDLDVYRALGQPPITSVDGHIASMDSGALPALGIKVLDGHNFFDENSAFNNHHTAIVNEALARHLGSGPAIVGQFIKIGSSSAPPARIVAVVQNVHETDLLAPVVPTVYFPLSDYAFTDVDIVIRSRRTVDPQRLYSAIQLAAGSVAPGTALPRFAALSDRVAMASSTARYASLFLLALAIPAVFMVWICVWAQVTAAFRQRRQEIGIRLALGASLMRLSTIVLGRNLVASLLAAFLGAGAAWWLSHLIAHWVGTANAPVPGILWGVVLVEAYVLLIALLTLRGLLQRDPRDLLAQGHS